MISTLSRKVEDGKVLALAALVWTLAPLAAAVVLAVALVLALAGRAGLLVVALLGLALLAAAFIASMAAVVFPEVKNTN
jgi:hypothetical protein